MLQFPSIARHLPTLRRGPVSYTHLWLKSDAGKNFEFKGDPVFDNDKIGIAVRKGDPLREKLNTALQAIIEDGTYKQINDKYFPFSICLLYTSRCV